ncbi:hypothetical protein S245_063609, partial [Arachis hypogaea]
LSEVAHKVSLGNKNLNKISEIRKCQPWDSTTLSKFIFSSLAPSLCPFSWRGRSHLHLAWSNLLVLWHPWASRILPSSYNSFYPPYSGYGITQVIQLCLCVDVILPPGYGSGIIEMSEYGQCTSHLSLVKLFLLLLPHMLPIPLELLNVLVDLAPLLLLSFFELIDIFPQV